MHVFLATERLDSVRQLTQSASLDTGSNQGFFHKSHDDSSATNSTATETSQKTETVQKTANQTGLMKVNT